MSGTLSYAKERIGVAPFNSASNLLIYNSNEFGNQLNKNYGIPINSLASRAVMSDPSPGISLDRSVVNLKVRFVPS